eukprot:Gb_18584 [translate_table: standard]
MTRVAQNPEIGAKRLARWQKEQDQADRRLPRTMEPMQKYSRRAHGKRKESGPNLENEIRKNASLRNAGSHESEDKNPSCNLESSDKVIEDISLLAEAENYQPEARPLGPSPNLTCGSNTLSNITHEPVEDANLRNSNETPQGSTEGSPQGTNQGYTWQTLMPIG